MKLFGNKMDLRLFYFHVTKYIYGYAYVLVGISQALSLMRLTIILDASYQP